MNVGLQPGEVIKPIPGLEGRYSVTSLGRVYSHEYHTGKYSRELAQSRHPEGYMRVKLVAMNANSPTPVHRLVALAFHSNPLGLPQVNHIDGNKGNNCVENLEWVSNAENQRHAHRIGLVEKPKGEQHHKAILKEPDVVSIRRRLAVGSETLKEIARDFGVSHYTVFDIKRGKSWRHVA